MRALQRRGSALIVVLWILLIMAILIGTFAYEMGVEVEVTSYARNRFHAEHLAQAGIEWARLALVKKVADPGEKGELILQDGDDEPLARAALLIGKGLPVSGVTKELGEGTFEVSLSPVEAKPNINKLTDQFWEEILYQANVPEDLWPELIDCFADYIDPGDEQRLNGAESDDPFYRQGGYKCKNAPLDHVSELLKIKGFTEDIIYGTTAVKKGEEPLLGIIQHVTTLGEKINVNAATADVLALIPNMQEETKKYILEERFGPDKQPGTIDDGIKDLGQIPGMTPELANFLSTTDRKYIRVTSIGKVNEITYGIWVTFQADGKSVKPIYWREEQEP